MSRRALAACLLAFVLGVTACGGGEPIADEEAPDAADNITAADDGEEVSEGIPDEVLADADFVLTSAGTEDGSYGFALRGDEVTTPGPTLRVRKDEEVTIVLENLDTSSHDFVVVAKKQADAHRSPLGEALWGVVITEEAALAKGEYGEATFTPDRAGRFFYICSRPGHTSMWGRLIVE